jgi:outer membrane protein OmpA-like peptidoglycan-associated protein
MVKVKGLLASVTVAAVTSLSFIAPSQAQDQLPADNSGDDIGDYHPNPAYRESESHPLRILAYIVHPIGWVARELIFRPLSYFASSTPETRDVMGYREPFDFRKPSCFSKSDGVPDCRKVVPFNYDSNSGEGSLDREVVYFPDVNFDFNKGALNRVGREKAIEVSKILARGEPVNVELQGHTDKRGSDEYNLKLGMNRAEAVKAELVSLGIPASRLSTVSFGERKPLFNEDDDWAYAANRRVEVHMNGQKAEIPNN